MQAVQVERTLEDLEAFTRYAVPLSASSQG